MVERDNFVAAMVQTEPRWHELKILLVSAYMDGIVIGWHGRDIALDRSQSPC